MMGHSCYGSHFWDSEVCPVLSAIFKWSAHFTNDVCLCVLRNDFLNGEPFAGEMIESAKVNLPCISLWVICTAIMFLYLSAPYTNFRLSRSIFSALKEIGEAMANGLKEGWSALGCDSKNKIGALEPNCDYTVHTLSFSRLWYFPLDLTCIIGFRIRNQVSLHQLCPCLCSQRASSCFPQRAVGEWNWSD